LRGFHVISARAALLTRYTCIAATMVHGRGGASRRLSLILLTTSAFGATAAVAPAQPIQALVLPRQPAAADSDEAAQPGASVAMPHPLLARLGR
jgi:hypothetical protein